MREMGLAKHFDNLGRASIPIDIRRKLGLMHGESLEIFSENGAVIFKKYQPSCVFCDEVSNVVIFKGKRVCIKCKKEIQEIMKKELLFNR